ILVVPRIIAELFRVVAEVVGRLAAGSAGVLPLGLGGQPVDLACLLRQPAAVLHGGVVRHADRRGLVVTVAGRHVGVGGRRPGDGIGAFVLVIFGGLLLLLGRFLRLPEEVVLIPGHFALAYPERADRHRVLGPFVVAASCFGARAAHDEGPARDR